MIRTLLYAIVALFMIAQLSSCRPSVVLCTKIKPDPEDLLKKQATVLKYYLPKKVLTFYCPVTVRGRVAYDNGQPVLVDKAQLILSDTAFLYEDYYPGEGYYVITQNDHKSLLQTNIGFSYYGNGVIKTINAEANNLGLDIAETALSVVTSAAQTSSCFFTGMRAETHDTSFRFVINRKVEFTLHKTADTIDLKKFFPKMTTRASFIIAIDRDSTPISDPDTVRNGFIYYDPRFQHTQITYHNSSEKKEDAVVLDRNIVYPQLSERQVLFLPQGFGNGRVAADFSGEGFLLNVTYLKNKDAPAKFQQVNGMLQQAGANAAMHAR